LLLVDQLTSPTDEQFIDSVAMVDRRHRDWRVGRGMLILAE
jgi:hypothetical protein